MSPARRGRSVLLLRRGAPEESVAVRESAEAIHDRLMPQREIELERLAEHVIHPTSL